MFFNQILHRTISLHVFAASVLAHLMVAMSSLCVFTSLALSRLLATETLAAGYTWFVSLLFVYVG